MDTSTLPSNPLDSWWPYVVSAVVGLIACLRNFMGGVPCPTQNRIDGKLAIVTGSSGGIGFEICKELAKRGSHVIMCCRSLKKGVEAMNLIKAGQPNAILTLKKLDLTCRSSIEDFANCLINIKVDILINNAGVMLHPYKKTEDGYDIHLATNYLGHFLLTHLLMDNLRKSEQARIINVCAGVYEPVHLPLTCDHDIKNYVPKEWFAQSKLGLVYMTTHMSKLLQGTKITINALNPGMVRKTEHLRHSVIIRNWSVRISLAPWMWVFMKSPAQGAQTAIFLATDALVSHYSGKFYNNCSEEAITGKGKDNEAAKMTYEKTCRLLNINPCIDTSKKN